MPSDHDPLLAHSRNDAGVAHTLDDHLRGTAELARRFAEPLGIPDLAYWVGLWHDLGKASCTFQNYLAACSVDPAEARLKHPHREHKTTGAYHAHRTLTGIPATAAALTILGHHGGIPAGVALLEVLGTDEHQDDHNGRIRRAAAQVTCPVAPDDPELPWPTKAPDDHEMLIRFLGSCLVDADFLDTAAHFRPDARPTPPGLDVVRARVEAAITASYSTADSPINDARIRYRTHVTARAASSDQGIVRLTGVVGAGKTIAGLSAALAHAKTHGLGRIIIAAPYTSITEQNASVIESLAGADAVVEHHSNLTDDKDTIWRRLAAENWDAPVIVTTTVQLLESLFANRPSKIRKLHNLACSVIILDEPQTIPPGFLSPTMSALRWLTEHAGATVVLQTATQPAFELIEPLRGLSIPDWGDIDLGPVMDRVSWHWLDPHTHSEIADRLRDERQALCVVNSVKDAQAIAAELDVPALTTRMCPAHRKETLAAVQADLDADNPVVVVATQLIEAGVDVDFPAVYRVWAPLTSLDQTAGRCNRHARRGAGRMHVFELIGGRVPAGSYKSATEHALAVFEQFADAFSPSDPEVLRRWYLRLYGDHERVGSLTLDSKAIQKTREKYDFPKVASDYQLIDSTVPVIVPWGSDDDQARVARTVDAITNQEPVTARDLRHLARFSVNLHHQSAANARQAGLIESVETDHGGLTLGWWRGPYTPTMGLLITDVNIDAGEQW